MKNCKPKGSWWQGGCPSNRSTVFLYSLHPRVSRRILQDHFTQFGTVLKILHGSCGRCGLVFFASPEAARRVNGVTQLVRGRQLCPLLVDDNTARQFWRCNDDHYLCDSCASFAEKEDEDRLFIDVDEEEDVKVVVKAPYLRAWTVSHGMQREEQSLRLLRHLKQRSARCMFTREKLSYERLLCLRRMHSRVLVLWGKEEASVRLLRHLTCKDVEEQNLKRREEISLALLRHLKGTAARGCVWEDLPVKH